MGVKSRHRRKVSVFQKASASSDSVQRELETKVGRALISDEVSDGSVITIDAEGDKLVIKPMHSN